MYRLKKWETKKGGKLLEQEHQDGLLMIFFQQGIGRM